MPESLADVLRRVRADALVSQAETIHDFPACEERVAEAEKHIREAMLKRSLGQLTDEEAYRIFSILSFAMPPDAPAESERPPIDTFELEPTEPPETALPADLACYIGCPACDGGGKMSEE